MPGMVVIVSLSIRRINTTPLISPYGADVGTALLQGIHCLRGRLHQEYNETVSTIADKTKCIYATLLWADNLLHRFHQASQWLDICDRLGITLNPDRF